eukprot:scaffold375_cov378-Prasinococcus_capsulatus_cf.AAC.26
MEPIEGVESLYSPDDDIEEPETVDPRVETTLESLNAATDEINRLETRLAEARQTRKSVRQSSTAKLALYKQHFNATTIRKTAVYFEAYSENTAAQERVLETTRLFTEALDKHELAKRELAELEQQVASGVDFTPSLQDSLNSAAIEVVDAENQKTSATLAHEQAMLEADNAMAKVDKLFKKYKSKIPHVKPYYDAEIYQKKVVGIAEQNVGKLERALDGAKGRVQEALEKLNTISEHVHELRRKRSAGLNEEEMSLGGYMILVLPQKSHQEAESSAASGAAEDDEEDESDETPAQSSGMDSMGDVKKIDVEPEGAGDEEQTNEEEHVPEVEAEECLQTHSDADLVNGEPVPIAAVKKMGVGDDSDSSSSNDNDSAATATPKVAPAPSVEHRQSPPPSNYDNANHLSAASDGTVVATGDACSQIPPPEARESVDEADDHAPASSGGEHDGNGTAVSAMAAGSTGQLTGNGDCEQIATSEELLNGSLANGDDGHANTQATSMGVDGSNQVTAKMTSLRVDDSEVDKENAA